MPRLTARQWVTVLVILSILIVFGSVAVLQRPRGSTSSQASSLQETIRFLHGRAGISITPTSQPAGLISQSSAEKIALQLSAVGAKVKSAALADVRNNATANHGVCWLVEVTPSPDRGNGRMVGQPDNFAMVIIDGGTGFAYDRIHGYDPGRH